MNGPDAPYAGLGPEAVLDAVESLGLDCDGRLLALGSYENRVYRVGIADAAPLVAKFYRPDRWSDPAILEEHEFALELAAAELPVVAPLVHRDASLHHHQGWRFALFPVVGGHAPEPDDLDTLELLGRTLGRIHAIGATRPFLHRGRLDPASHGRDPLRFLLEHGWLPPAIEARFAQVADALLTAAEAAFDALAPLATLRLHGDCHLGNLLLRDGDLRVVDLDDCLTGPAVQDLWMLLAGDQDQAIRRDALLEGYTLFRDFDVRQWRLVEPLRSLRLLHFSAWLARRWNDPAFPAAFPWFGQARYWDGLLADLLEQLERMSDGEAA
ncbi:MAG: serine/threonine protein kinase [Xanthomonadales bacterium]|nr:serine/threonine protein kinase [Xanthomonadales bacterium]